MKDDKARGRRPLWRWILLVLLLALLLLLLLFWQRGRQPQTETSYFVPNQVLLTGPAEQVQQVAQRALQILSEQGREITLTPGPSTTLDNLLALDVACQPANDLREQGGYTVSQYEFGGARSQEEIVQAIEQARDELGFPAVGRELNWLTGAPPERISGDPWGPEGSPWGPEGSPWGPEGSPWGPEGSPWGPEGSPWGDATSPSGERVLDVAGAAFRSQWAFRTAEGVNWETAMNPAASPTARTAGQNVLVGVFDTSPFPPPMTEATFVMAPGEAPWTLRLLHPMAGGQPAGTLDRLPVPNHGLFAAGLVQAVAPQSQIELIRVLDDNGQGDLQTLNAALISFMQRVAGVPSQQQTQPGARAGVINLSLGVHLLPEEKLGPLPPDAQSLRTILDVATQCFPIVVVAASGNDSAGLDQPAEAQIPALWGASPTETPIAHLIGVAASSKVDKAANKPRERSCFSNQGEVTAPGGNGGERPKECQQLIETCQGDCEYGLLSLSISSPTGYTYWNGTSFAAPLVSGQAAVLLSNGLPAADVEPCILNSATLDNGVAVVNVGASLAACSSMAGQ